MAIEIDEMIMNVLFSSDDNYARHMGVAIYSLLKHNAQIEHIHIYVVNNHISEDNLDKLQKTVSLFENAELHFISFEVCESVLQLNLQAWKISPSAYARLLIAELLPKEVTRVLYLDCDTVICDSLSVLWNTDLQGCCLGAIQDQVPPATKEAVGMNASIPYFNSGVLLIDLDLWRSKQVGVQCIDFIMRYQGNVLHHDQGVLNGVLKDNWYRMPLRYNVMTIHYFFSLRQIEKLYKDHSGFYQDCEVYDSKAKPIILHFTPSFTNRPWEKGCKHPHREMYQKILEKTPWAGFPLEEYSTPWYLKLINWRYRFLPY